MAGQSCLPGFADVTGPSPQLVRVVATDAHEGPVYLPGEDALYFTSVPTRGELAIKRLALDGTRFPVDPARISVLVADGFDKPNGLDAFTEAQLSMLPPGMRSRMKVHFCGPTGANAVDAALTRPVANGVPGVHFFPYSSCSGVRWTSPHG